MGNSIEHFGEDVFSLAVMRQTLPKSVYKKLKASIEEGSELDPSIADVVANAMKDWAVAKGATHFCHWFQPMTGLTAEKHDSFITPTEDGRAIIEFSGKELIKGEPDASSFPSGGLRATFEARGYTAWDCTSPVFVKRDGTNTSLFIPTCFISYTGEVLDRKTPLLRSMEALSTQALRILKLFGNTTSSRVIATLGPEQEYFLIDAKQFAKRLDLQLCGRTLFGAPSPKGQELEDHYFGSLNERVASYMEALNTELWKLGVSATTQHNEVSPAQYELAPIYSKINIAADHNLLVMDSMRKIATRHGLACLLYEKPFAGVNGSGKHANWSIGTNDGANLLDPGSTPQENLQFLVFLMAVVKSVDEYAHLLRSSVASPGNDHRLGANEAPPAIISVFLGRQLSEIVGALAGGKPIKTAAGEEIRLGVNSLPALPKDTGDRNRTSPFAFTGNKFEFRMVGSAGSVSAPAFVLNTIVADTLQSIADQLEKAKDLTATTQKMLKDLAKKHQRVIFEGNNYAPEWVVEAEKRGLPNLKNAMEALIDGPDKKVIDVFTRQGILSGVELKARYETLVEQYVKQINIEAQCCLSMGGREILPAAVKYAERLSGIIGNLAGAKLPVEPYAGLLKEVSGLIASLKKGLGALEKATEKANAASHKAQALAFRDKVCPAMLAVRESADKLEMLVDADLWPMPTYAEMLFVK